MGRGNGVGCRGGAAAGIKSSCFSAPRLLACVRCMYTELVYCTCTACPFQAFAWLGHTGIRLVLHVMYRAQAASPLSPGFLPHMPVCLLLPARPRGLYRLRPAPRGACSALGRHRCAQWPMLLQVKAPLFHDRLNQEQYIVEGVEPERSIAFVEVRAVAVSLRSAPPRHITLHAHHGMGPARAHPHHTTHLCVSRGASCPSPRRAREGRGWPRATPLRLTGLPCPCSAATVQRSCGWMSLSPPTAMHARNAHPMRTRTHSSMPPPPPVSRASCVPRS